MIKCSYYLELSDDIRGERLRFVEAMKEATAINVQSKLLHLSRHEPSSNARCPVHVEEFKKELTREVLISTQEVSRLQRERQLLEQQIADLFAFYSKQKQSVSVSEHVVLATGKCQFSDLQRGTPNRNRCNRAILDKDKSRIAHLVHAVKPCRILPLAENKDNKDRNYLKILAMQQGIAYAWNSQLRYHTRIS